jgi:nitrogen regulatory protein P-II 1
MKLIVALIQPHKLPEVKRCLDEVAVHKMTVSNALGAGEQKGDHEVYRGVEHETNLLKKVRLEIAVNDAFVKPTIDAIVKGARTGEIGDGKIFVTELVEVVRIRSGETGPDAIG